MKSSTPARSSRLSFTFEPPGIRASPRPTTGAEALGLARPLQGPARQWSQDCDLSGEPGSSDRCVEVQPERILLPADQGRLSLSLLQSIEFQDPMRTGSLWMPAG